MTCRTVHVAGLDYRFCPDDPPREADRLRAVARARVEDEITRLAPEAPLTVRTTRTDLRPRVSADGLVGLVGNPARLFPGLDAASVDIDLAVAAARYLPHRVAGSLGPLAGFPDAFAALDLGTVPLHREGVVLRGRTVRRTGLPPTPLAGVDVDIDGVWSTFPAHDVDPLTVMESPDLVSLSPGLHAERTAALDGMRGGSFLLAVGEDKRLLAPAVIGTDRVRLSDRVNLGIGDVIGFEPTAGGRAEYVRVVAVDGASTDDQPADVALAYPLRIEHAQGALAVRAVPQFVGPPALLERDGIPGDRVCFLDSLGPIGAAVVVEIAGGPAGQEYQSVFGFQATSDADGFYRLPVLSRVAMVRLRAQRLGLPTQELLVSPDYRLAEQRVDVVFPIP